MTRQTTPRSRSRRGRTVALLALATALAFPTALLAVPPGGGQGDGRGRGGPECSGGPGADAPRAMRLLRGLDLDATQRDTLQQLLDQRRAGMGQTRDAARAVRDALRTAIHAEPLAEAAIREAASRLATVEADLALGRAETLRLVREQLTDEQRAMLEQRLARADERGEGRRGPRRGGDRSFSGGPRGR